MRKHSHYLASCNEGSSVRFEGRRAAIAWMRSVCFDGTPIGDAFRGALWSVDVGGAAVPLAYYKGIGGKNRLEERTGW